MRHVFSRLLPLEAPIIFAEKHQLFLSVLFFLASCVALRLRLSLDHPPAIEDIKEHERRSVGKRHD